MNLSLIDRKFKCYLLAGLCLILFGQLANAQSTQWIRPDNERSPPMWGIKGGIVFSIWPKSIEPSGPGTEGGPRGLIRVGYEYLGAVNLINYIAIEPVVNGDMEFSEVSPSRVDGKWGKFLWATDQPEAAGFTPYANTRGVITHPDPQNPDVEQLSFFICMEKFNDGAHPYLKVTIRSDKPGELGLQIFNQPGSSAMERCALTATMGNYSRLRLLYLKDKVIDSRKLFAGYDDIDFIEKEPYPASQMLKNKHGDLMVCAESNESFNELSAWPQQPDYLKKWGWRYRPFYKLTQYWRVDSAGYDKSLQVRVNGRAKYWGAENPDKRAYTNVPGGPAFENFELRGSYHPGQKFYFGLTRKSAGELIDEF